MNIFGKYELQVIRNNNPIQTINLTNTISYTFLEYLTQMFSGNVTTAPKYVGFGLGNGEGEQSPSYTKLVNEILRVSIDTYNNSGTGILVTEKKILSATLQASGITNVTELGIFCINDTQNEAVVSTTVDTGTLVSRITLNVDVQSGDEFLIKRIDTVTGG